MRSNILSFEFEESWRKEFIGFPFHLYKEEPQWIPPLRSGVDSQLSPANPFFKYGRARNFLYRKGRETLGRVSAILNPEARSGDEQVGYFAFFECVPDSDVARALLDAASEWLHKEGARILRGPIQYSTYSSNRFVIKRGTAPPYFLEPYNPEYYPELLEKYGFAAIRRYYSCCADQLNPDAHLSPRDREELSGQGFQVRTFDKSSSDRDLRILYDLSERSFADNFSFTSIPWREFHFLHSRLIALVDPDYLLFVFAPGGEPAGYVFCVPDYAHALRAMKGRNHLLSKARFLWGRRKADTAILKTLAVHPDYQGNRLGNLLTAELHETAIRKGCRTILYSTIIKDNPAVFTMTTRDSSVIREYAIYEKT